MITARLFNAEIYDRAHYKGPKFKRSSSMIKDTSGTPLCTYHSTFYNAFDGGSVVGVVFRYLFFIFVRIIFYSFIFIFLNLGEIPNHAVSHKIVPWPVANRKISDFEMSVYCTRLLQNSFFYIGVYP